MQLLSTKLKFAGLVFTGLLHSVALQALPDAGITGLAGPVVPFCPGNNTVLARLTNFGTDTIYSADIQWSVNGTGQPAALFNDTLAPGQTISVLLGSFFFNRKGTYTVDMASGNPNGQADADPGNDSFTATGLQSMMSGSYSAGIVSDYALIQDAVTDLANRGICNAVEININPGIFSEQLVIPEINGASALKTVTFQSSTADSTTVIITHPSSSDSADNFTLKLDGADYIVINQLTLERSGSLPNAHVVELTRNATDNILTHLRIHGAQNVNVDSLAAGVFTGSSGSYVNSDNVVSSCVFRDGAAGVYLAGTSVVLPGSGNIIENNRFVDQAVAGITLVNQDLATVRENRVSTAVAGSEYVAIQFMQCQNKSQVMKNKVEGVPGKGLVMRNCTGSVSAVNTVANNFIHVKDSAAIDLFQNSWLNVVFNSLHQSSPDTLQAALQSNGSTQLNLVNNIFMNSSGGYAVSMDSVQGVHSDRNDLFTTGNHVAFYQGNRLAGLSDWTAATGQDSASVAADPGFLTADDLHATAWEIDDAGIPFGAVSDDVDGEFRDTVSPDMGADEFTAQVHDLAVVAVAFPSDSACDDTATMVRVVIFNSGSFSETGFSIHAHVSGFVSDTLTEIYSGTLAAGAGDTVAFTATLNTSGGGSVSIVTFVSSPFDVVPANDTAQSSATILPHLPPAVAAGIQLCAPDTVLLTATGSASLYWYDEAEGGNLLATVSTYIFFAAFSDTLYVQNGDVCPAARAVVPVIVQVIPQGFLGNDTVIVFPQTVLLSAGPGFATYVWNTGDTSQTLLVDSTGLYSVTVTDSIGCTATDSVHVTVITSLEAVEEPSIDFHLLPNPATGRVIVRWNGTGSLEAVRVFDSTGRCILEQPTAPQASESEIPAEQWAGGLYFVQVNAGGRWMQRTLVVPGSR